MNKYEKAIEILKKYKQEKLLKNLEKNKDEKLVEQILSIDFEQIKKLKEEIGKENQFSNDIIEQISYIDNDKLTNKEIEEYKEISKEIISKGKYTVVTMAGGQRNKIRT